MDRAKGDLGRRHRPGIGDRLWRIGFGLIPFVVWTGGVLGVLYLAGERARPIEYPGLATISRNPAIVQLPGQENASLLASRPVIHAVRLSGRLSGRIDRH